MSRTMSRVLWIIAGIFLIIAEIGCMRNPGEVLYVFPFIFGMWLIFSGITKLVNSFDLQNLGVKGWSWFTVFGILFTVIGFISFTHPFANIAAMAWMIGLFLILQGIVSVLRGCFSDRLWL